MIERNAGMPPERRIEFRIGIHLGDVVEESDGDLMGDGVNIAARLEGIAKPGAICLSEDAYRQVKQRLDLAVTDLGPTQLKNITEPVRVYSLRSRPAGTWRSPRRRRRRPAPPKTLGPGALAPAIVVPRRWSRRPSYFLGAKPPRRPPRTPRRRPRISPSSCCLSPIFPTIRRRTISPTASPRT